MKKLIVGTTNPGKLKEWQTLLTECLTGVEILGIGEVGQFADVHETGVTFEENARIKAKHYARLTKEYVLSEDGGYEVDVLGGAPGVKSRRILPGDKEGTDQDLINYVFTKLKGVPENKRTVKLTCAVAVADPSGKIVYEIFLNSERLTLS